MTRDGGTFRSDEARTRGWRLPAALFVVALCVRAGAAWQTAAIFNDGPSFLRVAAMFHDGHYAMAFGHSYHPLYPLLTAWLAPLVGDFAAAGVVVSVVAGSVSVLALYAFLARAFDRRVALFGGLLLALHPYAAIQSADVQSEGLYLAFFLAALATAWRALEEAMPARAALAGVLCGLAYLVRPEGLGVALVAVAYAAVLLFQGRYSVSVFVRVAGALSAAVVVVGLPYVVHLHELTGEWMLTQKKSVSDLAAPPNPATSPAPRSPDRERFRPPPLKRPPARQAGVVPARIDFEPRQVGALADLLRVAASALHPGVLLLFALGVAAVRGPPGDRARFLALLVGFYAVVLYGLALNVGYLDRRHVLPPLVPLLGYAAIGLPVLGRALLRLARPRQDARASVAAAWIAVGLFALVTLPKTWAPHREESLAARRAAEWLALRDDLSGPVAAHKFRTAWYAGEAFVHLGRAEGRIEALEASGARFLIVDDVRVDRWPAIERHRARLTELHRVEAAGRTAFVYRLETPRLKTQSAD